MVEQHASQPCVRLAAAAVSSVMSARRAPAEEGGSCNVQAGAEKLPSCKLDSTPSTAASSEDACALHVAGAARLSSSTVRPLTCCSTACGDEGASAHQVQRSAKQCLTAVIDQSMVCHKVLVP